MIKNEFPTTITNNNICSRVCEFFFDCLTASHSAGSLIISKILTRPLTAHVHINFKTNFKSDVLPITDSNCQV